MEHESRRSPKVFSSIDATAITSVLAVVALTILIAQAVSNNRHRSVYVDPPRAGHALAMPGAVREDALEVLISEGGQVYFANDRIDPVSLHIRIADRLKAGDVERRVYIVADKHAPWGSVRTVLDQVRSAGVSRIAFLVDRRRS